jgi:hypothetical protein
MGANADWKVLVRIKHSGAIGREVTVNCPTQAHLPVFTHLERVIRLYTEVSHGAFQLGMT